MLIFAFVFRVPARPKPPTVTLSSESHRTHEATSDYSRFSCTSWSKSLETTAFGRCLVPALSPG